MSVAMFVSIWIIRYLGPTGYGLLSYSQSIFAITGAIGSLGLDQVLVREYVKGEISKEIILGTGFGLKLLAGTVVLSFLAITILFQSDYYTGILILIVSSGLLFQTFNVIGFLFQAEMRSKYSALSNMIGLVSMTTVKIVLLLMNAPLIFFAIATVFDLIVNATCLWYFYYNNFKNIGKWSFNKQIALRFIREGVPLILTGVSANIAMRIDQIMLKSYFDVATVGVYAAGVRLAEVFTFIPMVVGTAIYPKIVSANLSEDEHQIYPIIRYVFYFLVGLAIFINLIGSYAVDILFGSDYTKSSSVFNILIWMIPFFYLLVISNKLLMKVNKSSVIFFRQIYLAASNIILNLVFIPYYGIIGAAIATVSSVVIVLLLEFFSKETRWIFVLKLKALFYFH
jgi:O-antigen/teichoic acid export membrane protein